MDDTEIEEKLENDETEEVDDIIEEATKNELDEEEKEEKECLTETDIKFGDSSNEASVSNTCDNASESNASESNVSERNASESNVDDINENIEINEIVEEKQNFEVKWTEIDGIFIPLELPDGMRVEYANGIKEEESDDGSDTKMLFGSGEEIEKFPYTIFFDAGEYSNEIINPIVVEQDENVTFPELTEKVKGADFLYWVCTDSDAVYKANAGETKISPNYRTGNYEYDGGSIIFTAIYDVWDIYYDYTFKEEEVNDLAKAISDDSYTSKYTDKQELLDWYNDNADERVSSITDINFDKAKTAITNYFKEIKDDEFKYYDDVGEYRDLDIPGFKWNGFRFGDGGPLIDKNIIDSDSVIDFIKQNKLKDELKDDIKIKLYVDFDVIEEEAQHHSGGSGGGSGRDGSQYSYEMSTVQKNIIENLGPIALKHARTNLPGVFEYDVNANAFRYFVLDNMNNKKYIVNDWVVETTNGINNYYLTDANGFLVSGLVLRDGKLYYFSENPLTKGQMLIGLVKIGNETYRFAEDGSYADDVNRMPAYTKVINSNNIVSNLSSTEVLVSGFNETEVIEENEEEYENVKMKFGDEPEPTYTIRYWAVASPSYVASISIVPRSTAATIRLEANACPAHQVQKGWAKVNTMGGVVTLYYNGDVVSTDDCEDTGYVLDLYATFDYEMHNIYYYDQNNKVCRVDRRRYNQPYDVLPVDDMPKILDYRCTGYNEYEPGEHISKVRNDIKIHTKWDYDCYFISDIVGFFGISHDHAITTLQTLGYTVHGQDFQWNCKNRNFLYIGYKLTRNPNEAIRDITVSNNGYDYKTINGMPYMVVKDAIFKSRIEFNRNVEGDYIWLMYTKDKRAGEPIKWLRTAQNESYLPVGLVVKGTGNGYEFNQPVYWENSNRIVDFKNGTKYKSHICMGFKRVRPLVEKAVKIKAPTYRSATNWMGFIDGNKKLNQINMPGTHDSGAFNTHVLKKLFAKTQRHSIVEQLDMGVRYLDIRLGGYDSEKLAVFHGGGSVENLNTFKKIVEECSCKNKDGQPLYFEELMFDVYAFLIAHPTETVVMCISFETRSKHAFQTQVIDLLDKFDTEKIVFLNNRMATLKEVRGKIVIIDHSYNDPALSFSIPSGKDHGWERRMNGDGQGGSIVINDPTPSSQVSFDLENHYEYNQGILVAYDTKWGYLNTILGNAQSRASNNKKGAVIYTSGYAKPLILPHFETFASKINGRIDKYNFVQRYNYGWILGDYMEAGRAQRIYNSNNFVDYNGKEYID